LSDEAVLTSRAAICVAQFMHAPNHNLKIKEFKATESYKKTELMRNRWLDGQLCKLPAPSTSWS